MVDRDKCLARIPHEFCVVELQFGDQQLEWKPQYPETKPPAFPGFFGWITVAQIDRQPGDVSRPHGDRQRQQSEGRVDAHSFSRDVHAVGNVGKLRNRHAGTQVATDVPGRQCAARGRLRLGPEPPGTGLRVQQAVPGAAGEQHQHDEDRPEKPCNAHSSGVPIVT